MPARINVYCRRGLDQVDAASIRAALDEADLYTLAEALALPEGEEAAVDAMLPHLRVEENLEVFWKEGGGRPIQIDIVDGEEAQAHLAEELAELSARDDAGEPGPRRVLDHLRACTTIASLEMGLDVPESLGGVLAEVIAFHLAAAGDGIIWFFHAAWASPDDWGETLWATPPVAPSDN